MGRVLNSSAFAARMRISMNPIQKTRLAGATRVAALGVVLGLGSRLSPAATNYVSLFGLHKAPYLSWTDAATNIQAAVDAASIGDTVLIESGDYLLPTPVVVDKGIMIR